MSAKYKISFRLRPSGEKNIVYLVQLHVSYRGDRTKVSTGCQINSPDAWDNALEEVSSGYEGPNGETTVSINKTINRYKNAMVWAFKYFDVNDVVPTMSQVIDKFKERLLGDAVLQPKHEKEEPPKPTELSFFDVFDLFARECGEKNAWTEATFEKMATQKKVIYLTEEEQDKLWSLNLTGDNVYLEPVRDVFIFCCFTGLRHSDAYQLRRIDDKGDHIEVTTVKTADSLSIELNDIARYILDKYKTVEFPKGKALPVLENQSMNRDLKVLCKLAGIDEEIRITTYKGNVRQDTIKQKWELIGTHTARRTFIVTALSQGIPPNVVMKWTGHSDYKAMKPYIDIVDSIKAQSMTKFNNLL